MGVGSNQSVTVGWILDIAVSSQSVHGGGGCWLSWRLNLWRHQILEAYHFPLKLWRSRIGSQTCLNFAIGDSVNNWDKRIFCPWKRIKKINKQVDSIMTLNVLYLNVNCWRWHVLFCVDNISFVKEPSAVSFRPNGDKEVFCRSYRPQQKTELRFSLKSHCGRIENITEPYVDHRALILRCFSSEFYLTIVIEFLATAIALSPSFALSSFKNFQVFRL